MPMRTPYSTFKWTEDTTTYSATIDEGSYTISELLTALSTAMETASGIACAFSVDTTSFMVSFLSLSQSITIVDSYLATSLGFVAGQSGNSITATNSYNLASQDHYWTIVLKNIPSSFINKTSYMTFKIPVHVDVGYMVYYNANAVFDQWADTYEQNITYLDVVLTDAFGNELDLNGVDFSFLIRIDCI
jgi:hypothetical protein